MIGCSIPEGWMSRPGFTKSLPGTSSLQTTVTSVQQQNQRWNDASIGCLQPAVPSVSSLARPKWDDVPTSPRKDHIIPVFTVNGQTLPTVDKFTDLRSTLSWQVHINEEVNNRLARASAAFGRLGPDGTRSSDETDSLQGCHTISIRFWNLDSLPKACQETEPFSHYLSAKTTAHFLAWEDPPYGGAETHRVPHHNTLCLPKLNCAGLVTSSAWKLGCSPRGIYLGSKGPRGSFLAGSASPRPHTVLPRSRPYCLGLGSAS